jgi:hypothetical protein
MNEYDVPNSKTLVDFDFDVSKVITVGALSVSVGYYLLLSLCLIARPNVTCVSHIYMSQSSSVLPKASIV